MYGKVFECYDFVIFGKVFLKRWFNKEIVLDKSLRDVIFYYIICKDGKIYVNEIKVFDDKFKVNFERIYFKEIKNYK